MKIYVNTEEKKVNMKLPNGLVFNRIIAWHMFREAEKKGKITFDKATEKKLKKLYIKAGKKYKGLKLVEVYSSDGDEVEITL